MNSRKTDSLRAAKSAESRLSFGAALAAFALWMNSRKTDSLRAAKSAESRLSFGAALAAFALWMNSRKTDSLRAAKSAESRLSFDAALAAFALWKIFLIFGCAALLNAAKLPSALGADPPIDKAHPAAMETMLIESHGSSLNALMYIAAGAGPHPAVILLHGFPGNEKNLDLAQAVRRAGWNVLFFNYRGSWGSPGAFSFGNATEDVAAAIAYLRDPANAAKLRTDPKRIVLIGHSMGGFLAAHGGAHDPEIAAIGHDFSGEHGWLG
jgi:dipeptidyl aminopeptidase/acylaminoacyl peptidase